MKVGAAIFLCLVAMTTAHPVLYGDVDGAGDLLPLAVEYRKPVENLQEVEFMTPMMIRETGARVRRSPLSVRAEVNRPLWTSDNGRHTFEGSAFYQRNFNGQRPRQDWGGHATYTYRF